MSTTPLPEATPVPPASPPPAPGTARELFLFLLAAVALFPLVQFAAINLLALLERTNAPELPWSTLIQRVVDRHQYDAFFAVPLQIAYYMLLVGLLYILITLRRRLPFGQGLRLRPLPMAQLAQGFGAGALLALLVNSLNAIFPPVETPAFERLFSSQSAALMVIAASLLMAPLVEEIIFRGYFYTVLEHIWGVAPAVLLSGVLFGSIHFPQLWPGYVQMFLLCVVGVVFSLARARTGNTLASITLHFGYNGAISLLFLFSENFRDLPGPF